MYRHGVDFVRVKVISYSGARVKKNVVEDFHEDGGVAVHRSKEKLIGLK